MNMKQEALNYRNNIRRRKPDVLNVRYEQQTEARLRNAIIFSGQGDSRQPVEIIVNQMTRLQRACDDRLNLAVIDRAVPQETIPLIRQATCVLERYKEVVNKSFESAKSETKYDCNLLLAASRLLYLTSLPDSGLLRNCVLTNLPEQSTYVVFPQISGALDEALAVLPFKDDVVGFQVKNQSGKQTVSLFVKDDERDLMRIDINFGERQKGALNKMRKNKRILIAVEGDIAGHAARTLETARALRGLGYEPAIVGSGYYARPFAEEGFRCLPPFNTEQTAERNRIIAQARGEGKGLFFWDFGTVGKRVKEYKNSLRDYVQAGVDMFLCDMNPIIDIAVSHLQKETQVAFPKFTETHDIRLSPRRILRTLKVLNLPIGGLMYKMNNLPGLEILDPKGWRFKISHFFFNEIADAVMGLPLSVHDKLHGSQKHRVKFTDFMYGRDGTLEFCFKTDGADSKIYPIGLQADKGRADGSDLEDWETKIPSDRAIILNAQGSTYHQKAWNAVVSGLTELSTCFSVHATGMREDQPIKIERSGYKVGYVPGYRVAQLADVVINHGGFGTISQWLLATTARIGNEREGLVNLVQSGNCDRINEFLENCRGISRSLSLCNTFEQENNALLLNEIGGNNVCRVTPADVLLKSPNPEQTVREMVEELLESPVTNQERIFWMNLLVYESTMNAPAHAALVLERLMLSHK